MNRSIESDNELKMNDANEKKNFNLSDRGIKHW
jgi:hypothetical protein